MGKKDKKSLEVDESQSPEYIKQMKEGGNDSSTTTTTTTADSSVTFSAKEMEEIDAIDSSSSTSRLAMLAKFVSKVGMGADLTHSSIPGSFILPKSTLSYFSDNYSGHFDYLLKANNIDDEFERMLQVYRYLTSTLHQVVDTTRKPLNPVLGETYEARVESEESNNSFFFAEQISHHPPISCSTVYNKEKGVRAVYHHPVQSSFMGTYVKIAMLGATVITLDKHQEEFQSTLPYMAIRIFRGFSEYVGKTNLTSNKSNYRIKTIFFPKPLLFGSYNGIESTIYKGKEKIFKIKGQWSGELKITNIKTNETSIFYKNSDQKNKIITPEQLLPTDSTVVWKGVFESAATGQGKDITKEKTKVEEEQRRLVIQRKEKSEEWKPLHFHKEGDTWIINEQKS